MFEVLGQRGIRVFEYGTVGSTNSEARSYALDGGKAPALFVAGEQTLGRGRMGRNFYSPADTGLYMSLLLDVTHDAPATVVRLTTSAAVAVACAIEECIGIYTQIKWVNDIYLDGKKICGILAECFAAENKRYAVIGIGVNLSTKDFPGELKDIAASLDTADTQTARIRLAEKITLKLTDIYSGVISKDTSYIDEYRRRSLVIGKSIIYTSGDVCGEGVAEDIDGDGALCVRMADGKRILLNNGEISVRLKKEDLYEG